MDTYVVRRPIIDRTQKIVAYEILYLQDSTSLYNNSDSSAAQAIISFFTQVDGTEFLGGKDAFLTFTPNLIMRKVPKIFDEKKLVIQVEENILINPEALATLHEYKQKGYRVALINFDFNSRILDILPEVDILKLNYETTAEKDMKNVVSLAKKLGKKTLAYNVNTPEDRGRALVFGFDLVEGSSLSEMMATKVRKMEKLQSSFFRLMMAINRPVPEFDEIAKIIALDVSLTFSLLKLVNSAYFSLPNRVKDVKQAVTILGLKQLKQWIYLLSFVPDGGMTEELVKTSFLRATFCRDLAKNVKSLPISVDEAYLMGMFSTLSVLLNAPTEDVVSMLPIAQEIKDALLDKPGICQTLLQICVNYEKGLWRSIVPLAQELGVEMDSIASLYFESVNDVNKIWTHFVTI